MDSFNRVNFREILAAFIESNNLNIRKVASTLKCPISTLERIIAGNTFPSDEMLRQGGIMIELGYERYSKLSDAEREKISDALGVIGGGTLGFGSVTAAVGAMGSVAGLSAAGISSGLAAMGAIVGGGMAAGVAVVAAIPIAVAGMGWGIIQGVKYFVNEAQLASKDIDEKWELLENPDA